MQTSFSRNYAQCMYWFLAHLPASYLIARINERFLVLSAAQYPLIILGIGKVVRHWRNKKA
jgi:hypothetical protein